jgi:hypothetical protein
VRCTSNARAVGSCCRTSEWLITRTGNAGRDVPGATLLLPCARSPIKAYTLAPASPYRRGLIAGRSFYSDAYTFADPAVKADLFAQGGKAEVNRNRHLR